jgi:protein-tyrosine phosphatase
MVFLCRSVLPFYFTNCYKLIMPIVAVLKSSFTYLYSTNRKVLAYPAALTAIAVVGTAARLLHQHYKALKQPPGGYLLKGDSERAEAKDPDQWVPLTDRLALNFAAYEFVNFYRDRCAPKWLSFDRLRACSRSRDWVNGDRQRAYQELSVPEDAAAGNEDYALASDPGVTRQAYAAKIEVQQILGREYRGSFLAMPGPESESLEENHGFMKVIKHENVGLLCRLTGKEELTYCEEEYWKNFTGKPQELQAPEWRDYCPMQSDAFVKFVDEFEREVDCCFARGQNVAIHCKAGVGRTGTLIAAYLIKKQINNGMQPDPWGIVLELRKRRRGFVANEAQFLSLYHFAKHLLANHFRET